MKKLFLALFAMVAFVACEKEEVNPTSVPSKYDFAFDENGVCYSKNTEGISEVVFTNEVVGYGWLEIDTHRVKENGQLEAQDYWSTMVGFHRGQLYFESAGMVKDYWGQHTDIPGIDDTGWQGGFYPYNSSFEAPTFYFDKNNRDYYSVILEVTDDKMVWLRKITKDCYVVATYKRMTDDELTTFQEEYLRDWSEGPTPDTTSGFRLRFDDSGMCYSKQEEYVPEITKEEVKEELFGYGWVAISSHLVLENGRIMREDYLGPEAGGVDAYDFVGKHHLMFDSEGVVTDYYMSGKYSPQEDKGFATREYRYEYVCKDVDMYVEGVEHSSYQYRILTIDQSNERMWCLHLRETPCEANGGKYVYTLDSYRRMTEEQLAYFKQTYTRNWDEEF